MTRVFTVTRPEVKRTRNTPRKPGRFGAGLLASIPTVSADHTHADEAWLVAEHASAEDRLYDAMEADAIALARVDLGLCF